MNSTIYQRLKLEAAQKEEGGQVVEILEGNPQASFDR